MQHPFILNCKICVISLCLIGKESRGQGFLQNWARICKQVLQAVGSGRAMAVEHEFRSEVPWQKADMTRSLGGRVTLQYAMVLVGLSGIDGEGEAPLTSR